MTDTKEPYEKPVIAKGENLKEITMGNQSSVVVPD